MLIVRLVIGSSRYVNVTEQVDTVSPTGLTIFNVTEHGGQETGTVGTMVTCTIERYSLMMKTSLKKVLCNKHKCSCALSFYNVRYSVCRKVVR